MIAETNTNAPRKRAPTAGRVFGCIGIFCISIGFFPASPGAQADQLVHVAPFEAFESEFDESTRERIHRVLMERLRVAGYRVDTAVSGDTRARLAAARAAGATFLIGGYYSRRESGINLSLYGQIYNPATGYLIDALNVTDQIEEIRGIQLDPEELRVPDEKRVLDFVDRLVTLLRSNPRGLERRRNLDEYVFGTSLAGAFEFPVKSEDVKKSSDQVFRILEENERRVSVASNVVDDIEKQPASVSIITRNQIRLSGARTLNELLAVYVPGYFTVEDQDDVIAGFRGLAPDSNSKILLLVNGHNLNTEWFWGPPDAILQGMDPDYIERIEVIRGPGSVTLGQGALLGVINVITRVPGDKPGVSAGGVVGRDAFGRMSLLGNGRGELLPELRASFYLSSSYYRGQELRAEGWAREKDYEGREGFFDFERGLYRSRTPTAEYAAAERPLIPLADGKVLTLSRNPATSGNRLKRSEGRLASGLVRHGGFEGGVFYANQQRDNYNFYRDRNELQNIVRTGYGKYTYAWNDHLSLTTGADYTVDDLILHSHGGFVMGGTREYRYGLKAVLNIRDLPAKNNLALGVEFRRYDMGQPDKNGNNFIVNNADQTLFDDVNNRHRYVFSDSIIVAGFFIEDFYALADKVDLFAAARFDEHGFWGSHWSPRLGGIYSPADHVRLRLSYQHGFRGAPGVTFAGGFQKDGLLRADNYGLVEAAAIPTQDRFGNLTTYRNVPEARPETIDGYEFAVRWKLSERWSFDGVLFYNIIRNIVDVGVIFADSATFTMPNIGSDEPGDWNGYFFFRNLPGEIRNGGAELSLSFTSKNLDLRFSHSLVRILSASDELFTEFNGGMYLTSDRDNRRHRAFPESVTRAHILWRPAAEWELFGNWMYYPYWYSPLSDRVVGQHVVHAGVGKHWGRFLDVVLTLKNATNSGKLWPMNSNAGGQDNSSGTPALENRSVWLSVTCRF